MFLLLKAVSWYRHHSEKNTRNEIFNKPLYPPKKKPKTPGKEKKGKAT
jgi:hypothetical protein